MKIGKYDWSNVIWTKEQLQNFKDVQYIVLYVFYVLLDVYTTIKLIDNPLIIELNPLVNFIFTLPIGFIIFYMIKHISLELIIFIIRSQNKYIDIIMFKLFRYKNNNLKYTGYITYFTILIMSIYVAINNIFFLLIS